MKEESSVMAQVKTESIEEKDLSVGQLHVPPPKKTCVRYLILFMLLFASTVNFADRATISMAGSAISKQFGFNPVTMGFIFSSFGWAYALGQIPGGWLLDRYGSRKIYGISLFLFSLMTLLQGFIGLFSAATAVVMFFVLRFILGLAESPAFPANGRIVSNWFPTPERGTATSVFNSAQYAALVIFSPIMGWLIHLYGWPSVFFVMGSLGLIAALVWPRMVYAPKQHPRINQAELNYIEQGGGLVNMDDPTIAHTPNTIATWSCVKQLLKNRMLLGIYLGQYCITALTYFFITWFPVYLVQGRGMPILKVGFVAALPAVCGFTGGILGGMLSDYLLKRGRSLTFARKMPFLLGMLLSGCLVICNYVDSKWIVVALMALAFFGKGIAAIGWAVISDAAPKEATGLAFGVFNGLGNIAGIVTPITIGFIVKATGSFNDALLFVGAHSLLAILGYLLLVGKIHRVELKPA